MTVSVAPDTDVLESVTAAAKGRGKVYSHPNGHTYMQAHTPLGHYRQGKGATKKKKVSIDALKKQRGLTGARTLRQGMQMGFVVWGINTCR